MIVHNKLLRMLFENRNQWPAVLNGKQYKAITIVYLFIDLFVCSFVCLFIANMIWILQTWSKSNYHGGQIKSNH